jgi:DNA repair ATPase RecN
VLYEDISGIGILVNKKNQTINIPYFSSQKPFNKATSILKEFQALKVRIMAVKNMGESKSPDYATLIDSKPKARGTPKKKGVSASQEEDEEYVDDLATANRKIDALSTKVIELDLIIKKLRKRLNSMMDDQDIDNERLKVIEAKLGITKDSNKRKRDDEDDGNDTDKKTVTLDDDDDDDN